VTIIARARAKRHSKRGAEHIVSAPATSAKRRTMPGNAPNNAGQPKQETQQVQWAMPGTMGNRGTSGNANSAAKAPETCKTRGNPRVACITNQVKTPERAAHQSSRPFAENAGPPPRTMPGRWAEDEGAALGRTCCASGLLALPYPLR